MKWEGLAPLQGHSKSGTSCLSSPSPGASAGSPAPHLEHCPGQCPYIS